MKSGKIIAIIAVLGLLGLMFFMISQENAPVKTQEKTQEKPQNLKPQISKKEQILNELNSGIKEREFAVSRLYLVSCSPCHGDDGRGKIAPPIGSKSKDEILARLNDYKQGRVKNSLMNGILSNVSDENLTLLADEISKFKSERE